MIKVNSYLDSKKINYRLHTHPAVFTVEEAKMHCSHIPGLHCKNLFLRNNKGKKHFLLVLPGDKSVDLKSIGNFIGERLSFASSERLKKYLVLEPGSVSPFGLINDINSEVIVYIDKEVYDADLVTFHPNVNTATLELTQDMFHCFLKSLGNTITVEEF